MAQYPGSHGRQTSDKGIHAPIAWIFTDQAARLAFNPNKGIPSDPAELTADDICKFALQESDGSVWMLSVVSPPTWAAVVITVSPVTGPGVSTDNALVRFDGATGVLLKDSPVVLDDNGNLVGVGTINGNPIGPLVGVQARRTTIQQLTAAWADVAMDTTDVETDAAVLDHDLGTNDDRIIIGATGLYWVWYAVSGQHNSVGIETRVRVNDATVVPGSMHIVGTDTHNQTHNYHMTIGFLAQLTAGEFLTLQMQWDAASGISPGLSDAMLGAIRL